MIRSRTPVAPRPLDAARHDAADRRVLRHCFAAAAVIHAGLLFLPVPWTDAVAAPEPPPRVVHRIVSVLPEPPEPPEPDRPEPPPEPREARTPIPVPETLVDEPPPESPPLPTPDLDTLADLPMILPEGPPPPAPPEPGPDGPVHVLGAIVPPEAVFAPRPEYPEAARRVGRAATVVLQATIDTEGRVTDLEILRGAPLGMTESALAAVRRWRFRPATLKGSPVAVYYQLTVRFTTR